jgi:hypothetical protein
MDREFIQFNSKSYLFEGNFQSLSENKNQSNSQASMLYLNMFIQDINSSLIPLGGKNISRKPFAISTSPNDQKNLIRSNLLFHNGFFTKHDLFTPLEESITQFFSENGSSLFLNGNCFYEIIPIEINDKSLRKLINENIPVYILRRIPGRLILLGNYYIQPIPKALWKQVKKRYVLIPKDSVWKVKMPTEPYPFQQTKVIINGLKEGSKKFDTATKMFNEMRTGKLNYSGSFYTDFDQYISYISKSWGWGIRNLILQNSLEFYTVYRMINYSYALSCFRENILEQMNILLERLQQNFRISIDGLVSSSQVVELKRKILSNQISFKEVLDIISFY